MAAPPDLHWTPQESVAGQLIDYFCIVRTEDGQPMMAIDAFLPLAGALAGISSRLAGSLWMKVTHAGPPPETQGRSLLTRAVNAYCDVVGIDPTRVVATSTFSNERGRAFSQRLKETGRNRVEIWLPASGVFAALALVLSHLAPVIMRPDYLTPELEGRLNEYNRLLTMLAAAASDGGSLVIQDLAISPARPHECPDGLMMFNAALDFAVFHEMAHIELGHLDRPPADPGERRARELTADQRALQVLNALHWENHWNPLFGAAITLLARSLVTPGPDDATSPTHPPLVERMQALIRLNDHLIGQPLGASRDCLDPFLRNVLPNLHDRDRCPAWLGQTRLEVLGLPPDHVFPYEQLDFQSQGRHEGLDHSRQPAAGRDLMAKRRDRKPLE